MKQDINKLAQTTIDALQAINSIHKEWRDTLATKIGHGQYMRRCPEIADHLHIELLEAITDFDCNPMETLAEIELQSEDEPDDYDGGRFDYYTTRGVSK